MNYSAASPKLTRFSLVRGLSSLIRLMGGGLQIILLAAALFGQLAYAEETLEDVTRLYEKDYEKLLELSSQKEKLPPDSKEKHELSLKVTEIKQSLFGLGRWIRELGGNTNEIEKNVKARKDKNVIKADSGAEATVSLEETKKEYVTPADFVPWKLDNWPNDSRRMHDKKFMTRLRILEENPTDWASSFRRMIEIMDVRTKKQHFLKIFHDMYAEDEGMTWLAFVKQNRNSTDWVNIDEWVDKVASGFANDDKFTKNMVKEVFDQNMQATNKTYDWNWLNGFLRITHIRREFKTTQENIRKLLLIKRDKWSLIKSTTWRGRLDTEFRNLIRTERKMLWLLGYSARQKFMGLIEAEKYKSTELEKAQQDFYRAYIRREYWKNQKKWYDVIPTAIPTSDKKFVLKNAEKYRDKREDDWNEKVQKLTEVKLKIANASKGIVLKNGLQRNLKLELFIPHIVNNSDMFYKESLSDKDYKKFENSSLFVRYHSDDTYYKFLPAERERSNFDEQRVLRSPDGRK